MCLTYKFQNSKNIMDLYLSLYMCREHVCEIYHFRSLIKIPPPLPEKCGDDEGINDVQSGDCDGEANNDDYHLALRAIRATMPIQTIMATRAINAICAIRAIKTTNAIRDIRAIREVRIIRASKFLWEIRAKRKSW